MVGTTKDIIAHERALAPVEEIGLAVPPDWEGLHLRLALDKGDRDLEWLILFEIACALGYRNALEETPNSTAQLQRHCFISAIPSPRTSLLPRT